MASSDYDGSIRIDTRIDNDGLIKGIDELNSTLKQLDGTMNKFLQNIQASFNGINTNVAQSQVNDLDSCVKDNANSIEHNAQSINDAINSEIDTSNNVSAINAENEAMNEYGRTVQMMQDEFSTRDITSEMSALEPNSVSGVANEKLAEMNQLKQSLSDMEANGSYFGTDEYDEAFIRLKQLENEMKEYKASLVDAALSQDEGFSNLNRDLLEASQRLSELSDRGMGFGNSDFDKAYTEYIQAGTALKDYKKNLESAATGETKVEQSNSRLCNALDKTKSTLSKVGTATKTAFSKMWSAAKKAFSAVTGGSKSSKKGIDLMDSSLGRAVKRIGRMAKTILFFRLFRTALTNLRNYMGDLLKSNNQFVSSLGQVKGNLKTAFQPVFDAIMPAINAMMSGLVKLSGYLAQITSMIFGKSVKAMQNQAKAIGGVGKAAKEANKSLAKYDELNVISKNNSDSTSSGVSGTAATYGDIQTSDKLANWINKLKDNFKDGNFEEIGRMVASGINNALDNIDWETITAKAKVVGTDLARILNGFIDELDFKQLGSSLGNGLNTAIEFALGFIETFDFERFGEQLANGINGLFNTVNWDDLGKTITTGLDGIVKSIKKFVKKLDKKAIGWSISTLINSLLYVDWGEVSSTLSDVAKALLDMFISTLSELDWEQLGRSIVDFILGIDWIGLQLKIDEAFLLLIWGLGKAILGAIDELAKSFWPELESLFGKITDWFIDKFDKAWNGIKDIFGGIGEWFTDRYHDVCNAFSNVGTWFYDEFNNAYDRVTDAFGDVGSFFSNAWEKIKSPFSKVASWFEDVFSTAWQKVKDVFCSGGKVFDGIKDGIADTFKTIVDTLIRGINVVISKPFKAINEMLNSIRNVSVMGYHPFNDLWGKNPIPVPEIPPLATGAVLPANNPFLAVVGDQTRGTNIEAPADLIKQMAKEAIEEAGGGAGNINVNVILEGDASGMLHVLKTEVVKEQAMHPNKPVWGEG